MLEAMCIRCMALKPNVRRRRIVDAVNTAAISSGQYCVECSRDWLEIEG